MLTIAAVIPARNAARLLTECLAAIDAQDHPADEIWIIVAPSEDGTLVVARSLADEWPAIRVEENPAGNRAAALNLVIGQTSATALAFVDAQALIAPDYLSAALASLNEVDAAVVGGHMQPIGRSAVGKAMAVALQSPFGVGDSQFHFTGRPRPADSVYLGVYRASVFKAIGVYNTALLRTEDDDLNARVREAGLRIWLDPRIRSTYRCRETLIAIWQQYFGYGEWKVSLLAVRPAAFRVRHLAPPLFVMALVIGLVTAMVGLWWPLATLAGAWSLLGAAFGLSAPAASPVSRLLFLPVTLTMQMAYGVGVLKGIVWLPRRAGSVRAAARAAEIGTGA